MKSMKKLVLASLALLVVMMVILPLVGCDTNAGSSSTLNTDVTSGSIGGSSGTGDNGNGSDNTGNNGDNGSDNTGDNGGNTGAIGGNTGATGNTDGENIVFKTILGYSPLTFTFNTKEGTVEVDDPVDGKKYGTYTGNLEQDGIITMTVNDRSGQSTDITGGDSGNTSGTEGDSSDIGTTGGSIKFENGDFYIQFDTENGAVSGYHPLKGYVSGIFTGDLNQDSFISITIFDYNNDEPATLSCPLGESGKKLTFPVPYLGDTVLTRSGNSENGSTGDDSSNTRITGIISESGKKMTAKETGSNAIVLRRNDVSVTLQDSDGDGYYEISTVAELYAFAAKVNAGETAINGELTANIVVEENVLKHIEVEENVQWYIASRDWIPIGNADSPYTGTFNGADYTISGLYFNDSIDYAGLFGYLGEEGMIQNLGVLDSNFYFYGNSGRAYGGGIVGYNSGSVINCYNKGNIRASSNNVGGIVGYNWGSVINCYNEGDIDVSSKTNCFVGGIVGDNFELVINCYNTGAISSDATSGINNTGGIAGGNHNLVINCYNTGTISGDAYSSVRIGGIVGDNKYGRVFSCYNTGKADVHNVAIDGDVTNCYYLSSLGSGYNGDGEAKEENVFASKEMSDLLNTWSKDIPTLLNANGIEIPEHLSISQGDTYWEYINGNPAPTLKAFNKS